MKKVTLLLLLALLVPWLTQSKIEKAKSLQPVNPQFKNISPLEKVSALANAGAYGVADSRVSGETTSQ
jgi:hypothetical protein